eukprot:gene6962-5019_t
MSESSSLTNYIAIGVGILAIALGGYYTFFMGCNNSVAVEKAPPQQPGRAAKKEETSEKPKYPNGPVSIFFGSQTGTSEGFARTLMTEGRKAGFDAKTCDLEEFDPEVMANTKLAIFLMATYGEGEPTDNAQKFMAWLKNENGDIAADFLANVKYVVFGLGNKQYEHFNRTGKQCNAQLAKLGAQPVYQYGEGDDDSNLEEDFDTWKSNLWSNLTGGAVTSGASDNDANETVALTFDLKAVAVKVDDTRGATSTHDASMRASTKSTASSKVPASLKHFFNSPRATVTCNRELRNLQFAGAGKEGVGSTRHIEINLHDVGLTYYTADNLAILPENAADVVEKFARQMGYDLGEVVEFAGKEASFVAPYPSPCSVRELLTSFADIQGPVRHSMLKQIIAYVQSAEEKAWALSLAANEHRAQFKEAIEEAHQSLFSLFVNGPLASARIPLADLLHIANPIQPRYYTISSSSHYHPDTVHITVSVTEAVNRAGQKITGLCSGFLQSLAANKGTTRVFVRPSTFRLPKSLASPVVLVGPGTGLAPMRALLQERQYLIENNTTEPVQTPGDCVLFFGCKHKQMDYIYRDEIERFQAQGALTELHTAFSRDGARKVYVQHLMTEDAARGAHLVKMLVDQGGSLYVCGATAMGTDVMNAVVQLLKTHQKLSQEEATAMVKKLQEKGRYIQELWTA